MKFKYFRLLYFGLNPNTTDLDINFWQKLLFLLYKLL